MVSKYIKALAMTIVILAIGLFAINSMDNSRASALADTVEARALELQASQQIFLYESVFAGDDICGALADDIESRKGSAAKTLSEIEAAQNNRLFSDSGLLKKKFLLQNVELYLVVTKAVKECGLDTITPVAYFYPDKYYCADCASQAAILDSVVSECPSVRVFAFPADLGIPVIDLLAKKYDVSKYPTVVFDGQKHDSVVSKATLEQELGCNPA